MDFLGWRFIHHVPRKSKKKSLHIYRVYPIIGHVRREVVKLEDFGKDLAIALIAVIAAKVLDEIVEAVKRKTPRKPGKHSKGS